LGLLWDVANIFDGGLRIHKLASLEAFPTLADCFRSKGFQKILENAEATEVATFFSRLLARIECVAKSRDLNRFGSVRIQLRKALKQLESKWERCILPIVKDEERLRVKNEVAAFKDQCGYKLNIYPTWQKGLLYAFSQRSEDFHPHQPAVPLYKMDSSKFPCKKGLFVTPPKTVIAKSVRDAAIMKAEEQVKGAADKLESIQAVRLQETMTMTKSNN